MSKARKAKRIKLVLFGGIGNQLFQYFAGQYLAHKSGGVLRVDSTFSQFGRSGHSDCINELTLPGRISPPAPRYSIRYVNSLLKRRTREFLQRRIESKQNHLRILRQYNSDVIGYDPRLEELNPPVTLVGYFQTWRYFQALNEKGFIPEILVKSPSSWFQKMAHQLEDSGQVLGIHVRRGDYVGNKDIGTLSVSYYEDAVQELVSRGVTWNEIWIYSDDVGLAQSDFKDFRTAEDKVLFVDSPSNSHSFESLLLMSLSSSLIIANSTFSWWAATLGKPEKQIVSPSKWFAEMDDPQDLYPDSWIRVPSDWVKT